MDKEFHYDIIHLISQAIGLSADDAYKIAYSSQFVDDNNKIFDVDIGDKKIFTNDISQSFDISKPGSELENIYMALHFIPTMHLVDNRKCSLRSKFVTTPNNKLSQRMLQIACNSKNPYFVGIALHAYADTWAHQNFSGRFEKFNCSKKIDVFEASIGHMDFLENPDGIGNTWIDDRLHNDRISNNDRFLDAIEHIFAKLTFQLELTPTIPIDEFTAVINKVWSNKQPLRNQGYKRFAGDISGEYVNYNKNDWLNAAVEIIDDKYDAKKDFLKSNWYGFQAALKKYKTAFNREFAAF